MLNLSPFCHCYEIVFHESWAKTDNLWNEIILGYIQKAYFAHSEKGFLVKNENIAWVMHTASSTVIEHFS